jgi:hypothetical protein
MFVALNQKVRARHATAYQNNLANFDRTAAVEAILRPPFIAIQNVAS